MRILILGPARHGKDTFAECLSDLTGWTFGSSSEVVARLFGRDFLERKYGLKYHDLADCMADRYNHREKWYEACREFIGDDLTKLARTVFEEYDIYVGMRGRDELLSVIDYLDVSIWVEAPSRVGGNPDEEAIPENLIKKGDCHLVVNNDGTYHDLCVAARLVVAQMEEWHQTDYFNTGE